MRRLLKSHGWADDIKSLGDHSGKAIDHELEELGLPSDATIAALNRLEIANHQGYLPIQETVNVSKLKPNKDPTVKNVPRFIDVREFAQSDKPVSPIPSDTVDRIYSEHGFRENTPEHQALEEKYGFGYRNLLGELMYAYVTSRPDLSYSVTTLSKFSTCPGDYHFHLLKGIAMYLNINWGI